MVRKGTKAMCHSPFTKKEQNKCQRQTPNAMRILNNLILKKTGQSPSQTSSIYGQSARGGRSNSNQTAVHTHTTRESRVPCQSPHNILTLTWYNTLHVCICMLFVEGKTKDTHTHSPRRHQHHLSLAMVTECRKRTGRSKHNEV